MLWADTDMNRVRAAGEYSGTETAYILKGKVLVTPTGEWASCMPTTVKAGDLVVFPDGMTCIWEVTSTSLTRAARCIFASACVGRGKEGGREGGT